MKKMNKLVAMLLAFVMVVGLMPSMTVNAHAHSHEAELQGIEEYPVLPLDTLTLVDISVAGTTAYFTFTPEVTDLYHFHSQGIDGYYADTYGYVYDAEMNVLASNDDAGWPYAIEGITGPNFCISIMLEAGQTYVLGARLYSSYSTSRFDVNLVQGHEYESAVTKESSCVEDGVLTHTCIHCGGVYEEVIPAAHTYGEDGNCIHCGEAYLITGVCGDDLTWTLDWFGKLTISGTGSMYHYLVTYSESHPAPWYDDYVYDITSVVIEEGVTSVGNYAFCRCSNLTEITLPSTIASLGNNAFAECASLQAFEIPALVTEIPDSCFSGCYELADLTWNENLTSIGSNAFYGCAFGDTVLPEGITKLGQYAFGGCGNLTKLTLPTTLTELDSYALSSMWNTKDFVFTGNAPTFGTNVFAYITATVWYPMGNETYTDEVKVNHGGSLTWKGICAGSHTFGAPVTVPATCETGSYMTSTCVNCDFTTVSPQNDDALGHNFNYEHYDGGCGDYSYDIVTCSRCDYYSYENYVWQQHDYTVTTVAPTCTEYGYDLYECSICGDNYKSNMTLNLGHDLADDAITVEPTCTEDGYRSALCLRCGETAVEKTANALGHDWDEENGVENDDGSITYSCTRCDAVKRTEGNNLYLGDNVYSITGNSGRKTKTFTAEADGTLTITLNNMTYHNSWAYDNGYTSEYWQTLGTTWVFNEGWFNVYVNNINTGYTTSGEQTVIFDTIEVKAGDVVTVEINHLESSSYYANDVQFNLNLDLEVAETPVEPETPVMVLGNNEIELPESESGEGDTYSWTAEADGTLTVHLSYLAYHDDFMSEILGMYWLEVPVEDVLPSGYYGLFVNGLRYSDESGIVTVDVKAGETVTIKVGNYYGYIAKAIVNLSFEGASAPVVPEGPALVLGDNNFSVANYGTTEVYSWVATEDTTVVVEMTKLVLDFYGWPSEENPSFYLMDRSVSMKINGEPVYTAKNTLDVKAGDVITVQLGNTTGFDATMVVNLSVAAAHEHSYEAVVTAPTCTEGGYTTYICECGDSYTADETVALGHAYIGEVTTEETCTENGIMTYTCSVCGHSYTEEVPASGHVTVDVDGYPATCEAPGWTAGVQCCVCNEWIVPQEEIPALGHTEEIIPGTDASCTETGLTEGKKCSVCDEILVAQEEIPALGHDWNGTACKVCDATRENPFTDVPEGSFYIDPVLWAVEKGVTTGATATTFNPNGDCLRAHVVTFLWRAAGSPEPTSTNNPFTDVKETDFFYKAVLWAVEKGITNGLTADTFGPFALCNRAQVVTFLWRANGCPLAFTENIFTDVKDGTFYKQAVLWAIEKGITNGISATEFGVESTCNRAQVVTFLYRAYGK